MRVLLFFTFFLHQYDEQITLEHCTIFRAKHFFCDAFYHFCNKPETLGCLVCGDPFFKYVPQNKRNRLQACDKRNTFLCVFFMSFSLTIGNLLCWCLRAYCDIKLPHVHTPMDPLSNAGNVVSPPWISAAFDIHLHLQSVARPPLVIVSINWG